MLEKFNNRAAKHANKIIVCAILGYFLVAYGQNVFEFGKPFRINFYFIGMSVVQSLFAWYVYLKYQSYVTSFWLFYCLATVVNQIVFEGNLSFFELWIGTIGIAYNLFKDGRKKYKDRK